MISFYDLSASCNNSSASMNFGNLFDFLFELDGLIRKLFKLLLSDFFCGF
nr:MAG TPA: hypothetical protein [Bacteriophage sp.]